MHPVDLSTHCNMMRGAYSVKLTYMRVYVPSKIMYFSTWRWSLWAETCSIYWYYGSSIACALPDSGSESTTHCFWHMHKMQGRLALRDKRRNARGEIPAEPTSFVVSRQQEQAFGITETERCAGWSYCVIINPLKTKRRLLYLKTQFVPRSKHFSSRL